MTFIVSCIGDDVDGPVCEVETLEQGLDKVDELFDNAIPAESAFWFALDEAGRSGRIYSSPVVEPALPAKEHAHA